MLFSCAPVDPGLIPSPPDSGSGDPEAPGSDPDDEDSIYDKNGIIKVPTKDYGRDTKDFDVYANDYQRPDVDSILEAFKECSALIRDNQVSYDDQLAAILALEDGYVSFNSSLVLAEICNNKDLTNQKWKDEYEYLSTSRAAFTQSVEDLFVACAQSPHVESFENDYFGEDIEEEYKNGGKYTDEAVKLLEEETALTNEYKNPDLSSVPVTYGTLSGTYDEVIERLKELYGNNSLWYSSAANSVYQQAYNTAITDIYVELVLVRTRLASAMGYDSYLELAYDEMGYEYTPDDMTKLLNDIGEFVVPMYNNLVPYFNSYFISGAGSFAPKRDFAYTVNTAYSIMCKLDSGFADIYSYMLQHKLYDVGVLTDKRFDASFTTYIEDNFSPYLFVTTTNSVSDLATLTHEFGHFIDAYVNNGMHSTIELAEVCSQGLEMLALVELSSMLDSPTYMYYEYTAIRDAFEVVIYQGFYAAFEHLVYSLDESEVTKAKLNELVSVAEMQVLGSTSGYDLRAVMIPHVFIAPMYVQSYFTSLIPALEIYTLEIANEGDGLSAYKAIIYRPESDSGFLDTVSSAGLSSPFESGVIADVMNELYFAITGIHYITSPGDLSNAA